MALLELFTIKCESTVNAKIISIFRKGSSKTVKLLLTRGRVILKFRGGTKATVTAQTGRGTFR